MGPNYIHICKLQGHLLYQNTCTLQVQNIGASNSHVCVPFVSVSNALDEAATALNRMRSKQGGGDEPNRNPPSTEVSH